MMMIEYVFLFSSSLVITNTNVHVCICFCCNVGLELANVNLLYVNNLNDSPLMRKNLPHIRFKCHLVSVVSNSQKIPITLSFKIFYSKYKTFWNNENFIILNIQCLYSINTICQISIRNYIYSMIKTWKTQHNASMIQLHFTIAQMNSVNLCFTQKDEKNILVTWLTYDVKIFLSM